MRRRDRSLWIPTSPRVFSQVQPGQLVQISKRRDDGWAFGTVMYEPPEISEERDSSKIQQRRADSGWFVLSLTSTPSRAEFKKLQKSLGGAAAGDVLKPPATWDHNDDPLAVLRVPLQAGDPKYDEVVAAFRKSATSQKVVSVERVQNTVLYQSYAAKRQTMCLRDPQKGLARFERRWLFHGSCGDVVAKITSQGFNRSFAGRNACAVGRGVYFATNASYSCSTTYFHRVDMSLMHRGSAAAATCIFSGDELRRHRGCDVEIWSRPADASGTRARIPTASSACSRAPSWSANIREATTTSSCPTSATRRRTSCTTRQSTTSRRPTCTSRTTTPRRTPTTSSRSGSD